jgi:hypothetical protein
MRKNKSFILIVIVLTMLLGCGSGGGGGGGDNGPTPLAEDSNANLTNLVPSKGALTPAFNADAMSYTVEVPYTVLSLTITPTAAGVNASIKVNSLALTSGVASTPIPLIIGENSITILVTAENGTTIKTYTIVVTRLIPKPAALTDNQAQNALYAVYAGIGYDKSKINKGNSILYDVMVDNFNRLAEIMILKTINDDPNSLPKFILFLAGSKVEFVSNSDPGFSSTLQLETTKLDNTGFNDIKATLNIAFNDNGYQFGNVVFFGNNSKDNNISAEFTGQYKAISGEGTLLTIKTVRINAGNGLIQQYPNNPATSIVFDNWALSYDVSYDKEKPVNYSLLSSEVVSYLPSDYNLGTSYADCRDYTVGGSFTIKKIGTSDQKFLFADGFNYKQEQWDYIQTSSSTIMSANGQLGVPGLDDYVKVSSVLNAQDPFTSATIISHVFENSDWSNDWVSGKLVFNGIDSVTETQAAFKDGSVIFNSGYDTWKVDNWRTALNPLK